jgi:hypothetical protein
MLLQLSKKATLVANPVGFFAALGWLHDADLESFQWDIFNDQLTVEIDDLYSNFYQLPEYPGKLSARFIASGIKNLQATIIASEISQIRILKFYIVKAADEKRTGVEVHFGEGCIKFECHRIFGMIR